GPAMVTSAAAGTFRGFDENSASVVVTAEPGTASITLPEDFPVSGAHFSRVGPDLVVSAVDGQQAVVRDYFAMSPPPEVVGGDGSLLDGSLAARLAPLAPGQVAQAAGPSISEAIGEVDNVVGTV